MKELTDKEAINLAKALNEYCEKAICKNCPFYENYADCIIKEPWLWDLRGIGER